jgi:hypothetical protein
MRLKEVPFEWKVPERRFEAVGYEQWEDEDGDPVFVDPAYLLFPERSNWRFYEPLSEEPALFRTFAESGDDIQRFANSFGALGVSETRAWSDIERVPEEVDHDVTVESVSTWNREITGISTCIEVWRGMDSYDMEKLRKIPFVDSSILQEFRPDPWKRMRKVSDADKAMAFVWDQIRQRLVHTEPRVLHVEASNAPLPLEVVIAPKNLLGALWLQLAEAIRTNPRHVKCRNCGRWFEVAARGRRSDVAYCSANCRTASYRLGLRAKELSAAGKSLEDIATELGRDAGFVQESLGDHERRGDGSET